jgi:hypothetical protein
MGKASTEILNNLLIDLKQDFKGKFGELIHKMNSFKKTSKETNAKVLSIITRVSELIQEDAMKNRNYKSSSGSDNEFSRKKKTSDSSNSEDHNDDHNFKKYVDNKFWKK